MMVRKVRSFHGLFGFYKRFVKDFNTIATHLTEVIMKVVVFTWGQTQKEVFSLLKEFNQCTFTYICF